MPVEKLDLSLMFVVYGAPEPRTGYLRGDLRALNFHFGQPLVDGLLRHNVKRVLEVGVGGDFEAMKQLSYQSHDGNPLFARDDIWAIDPDIQSEEFLRHLSRLNGYLDKFTRERVDIETFAARIGAGELSPFDFVFSKGVVSYGSSVLGNGSSREGREIGMRLIASMRDCLNPTNPDAGLMLSTQHYEEFLPFCTRDFEDLGLEVIYSETTDDPLSLHAVSNYQGNGIFRDHPDGVANNLIISKRFPGTDNR